MIRVIAVALSALVLQGCAHAPKGRQCEDNFSTQGSLLSEKQFQTYATLPNTSSDQAYASAYKMFGKEDFHIDRADAKKGLIQAYPNQNFSEKSAPWHVTIHPAGAGAQAIISTSAGGRFYIPSKDARVMMCQYLEEIGN